MLQRILLITLLCFSTALIEAQDKKTIDLESELEDEDENKKEGNIEDKEIIIEGTDEKLLPSKKKKTDDIVPENQADAEWQKDADQIVRKEKRGAKTVEKQAQIKAEYGTYNSLGVDIYITKRDKHGIYLLDYSRSKADAQGFGENLVGNSEYTVDDLKLLTGFKLSPEHKFLVQAVYQDNLYGLQSNSAYTQQFKRGGLGELSYQFRPSEFQKIDLTLQAQYIGSDLEIQNGSDPGAVFFRTAGDAKWQYIWGKRNAFNIQTGFWYAETELYENNFKQLYHVGNLDLWFVFPLFRTVTGPQKVPWQVDLTIGTHIFYGRQFEPIIGPLFTLDSFYGAWHSQLDIRRQGQVPDYVQTVLQNTYFKPVYYQAAEDKWQASWSNQVKISKAMSLKLQNGFRYYDVFYNPRLDTDELYTFEKKLFRIVFNKLGFEHTITDSLYYEVGIEADYHVDKVNLKHPVGAYFEGHFVPNNWDFSLSLRYISVRDSDEKLLDDFTLLNASIERKLNKTIGLFIRGENLFNESYQLAPPYLTSGLKAYAGMNILL